MNERIQELWVQCVRKHTKDPMNWQNVADEYAELIVQECASIVKGVPINVAGGTGCDFLIREHFGIEK
jgi:hypothetical protein